MKVYPSFTQKHLADFERDGYVVIRHFFLSEEVDLLYEASVQAQMIKEQGLKFNESKSLQPTSDVWYAPQDDVFGIYIRTARMVNAAEMILGGKVAHYYSRLRGEEPKTSSARDWHQDYGSWYNQGFLYPDMLSIMLALTKTHWENGYDQVLKGSHKMGRVEHSMAGEQLVASQEKV